MGQVITLQKIAGMRGEHVSGDEQETLSKRIFGAHQGPVEMFAIEFGHFHVADGQRVILPGRAIQRFAGVEKDVDAQSLVLEHVGNKAVDVDRDGLLAVPSLFCLPPAWIS